MKHTAFIKFNNMSTAYKLESFATESRFAGVVEVDESTHTSIL